MTEWIDVPVADVAVGDEVKVDGFGQYFQDGKTSCVELTGQNYEVVTTVTPGSIRIQDGPGTTRFRRSSIVAARRRNPEPSPKPGDWRCRKEDGTVSPCIWIGAENCGNEAEVYRASGGWSRDTRTGQPWVMRENDPAEIVIKARAGDMLQPLHAAIARLRERGVETYSDYYKRIGLTVVPVDRRGKR